jgi:putative DNA primase/helicase
MINPATEPLPPSQIALDYVRRGWVPLPVPFRQKGPQLKGWQNLRIDSPEQVTRYFHNPTNIGVILGSASGGLADVDIDYAKFLDLAGRILPKTGSVFGHASKPSSHRLYRVPGFVPSMKLDDPISGDTLIELRGDKQDGTPGFQTIFPGSIHPSGEPIEWEENGEPAFIEYNEIKRRVIAFAARTLIARYYPGVTTAEAAASQADPRILAQIARWYGHDNATVINGAHGPLWTPGADLSHLARPGRLQVGAAALIDPDPPQFTESGLTEIWTALTYINAHPRAIWRNVGGALFEIEEWPPELRRAMWDKWSHEYDRAPTEAEKKFQQHHQDETWRSFARAYPGKKITFRTIFYLAHKGGWDRHARKPLPEKFRRFLPAPAATGAPVDGAQPSTTLKTVLDKEVPELLHDRASLGDERILIDELARLDPISYARRRQQAAKQLGVGRPALDKAVARRRDELNEEAQETPLFEHWTVEQWPETVDGDALVLALIRRTRSHVVMTAEAALTVALWIMFAWVHAKAIHSPILMITSPEAECGKTTLLNLIGFLAPRSLSSVGISPAALYRSIEKWEPTLIVDEADVAFVQNEDLRAVVNSGWTRGQGVLRCVGDDNEPTFFPTFCPKAIGLKGKKLPDTTASRAIVIELKRKLANDNVADFRHVDDPGLEELRQQLMRWASDNIEALANASPSLPHGFVNRVAANWHLLLAIAEAAGGEWPENAREAAAAIAKIKATLDASIGIQLLGAIRDVFGDKMDCIFSKNLIAELTSDPEKPWAEYRRGKPLTQKQLANRLREYGITPETVWIGQESAKGYKRTAFEDAWRRYLSE